MNQHEAQMFRALWHLLNGTYPGWGNAIGDLQSEGFAVWIRRLSKDLDYLPRVIEEFESGRMDDMVASDVYGPSLPIVSNLIKRLKAAEKPHSNPTQHFENVSPEVAKQFIDAVKRRATYPNGYQHDRNSYHRGDFEKYLDASQGTSKPPERKKNLA